MTLNSNSIDPLEVLKAGNERFVAGQPQSGPYGPNVAQFANDPLPFATVLACSDARVPVEVIFDQTPGNVFVLRVAGNVATRFNLASIEFGIEAFQTRLVLVLGHSHCGAIRAALASARDGKSYRGHIPEIVDAVAPSVEATRDLPGDWAENAIAHNVARTIDDIVSGSELVANSVEAGDVRVAGGIYDVATGWVAFT